MHALRLRQLCVCDWGYSVLAVAIVYYARNFQSRLQSNHGWQLRALPQQDLHHRQWIHQLPEMRAWHIHPESRRQCVFGLCAMCSWILFALSRGLFALSLLDVRALFRIIRLSGMCHLSDKQRVFMWRFVSRTVPSLPTGHLRSVYYGSECIHLQHVCAGHVFRQ